MHSSIIARIALVAAACTLAAEAGPCAIAEPTAEHALREADRLETAGNLDGALAALRRHMTQAVDGETAAAIQLRAAQLHSRLGQSADAEQLYRELLGASASADADSRLGTTARFELATIYRQRNDWAEARRHLTALAATSNQSIESREARYWLAYADHREGRLALGRERLEELLRGLSPAIEDDSATPRERELWKYALYLSSQLAIAEDDWSEAKASLDRLRAAGASDPLLAEAEFWRGEIAYRAGDDQLARELFAHVALRTAALDEPWTALAPLRLAQLEAARQRWTETLLALDWLGWRWPDFPLQFEADYLRGRAHAGRGEFADARAAYGRVLSNPAAAGMETAAMAQWMIGETYFHQRAYAEARAAYQRAIDEHSHPEWQARAALQLGKCWELEGRWQNAANVYADAAARFAATESGATLAARRQFVDRQLAALR